MLKSTVRGRLLLMTAVLISGGPAHAQSGRGCVAEPTAMRAMRDCYRPVLVFAPTAQDASFQAQQGMLEQYANDMRERDLLYIPVLAKAGHMEKPLMTPHVILQQGEMDAIRARFQIGAREFVTVLVGKDGGEKFRSGQPVPVSKLDALVDAMPMGRREKQERSGGAR